MSLATDIADAVASELNSSGLVPVTAQRRVLPEFELADLKELKVSVVPRGVVISGSTRSVSQYEVAIDIGVQKRVGSDVDGDVKTLGDLVDAIADHLRRRPLPAAPYAAWVSIANDPLFAPEHLSEQRVFTSVLTLTYRVLR